MLEVSGSRRNRELDVSSPSPSPTYIRLIQRQAAQVSDLENRRKNINRFSEQGNAGGVRKGPCGACVSHREPGVREDGKMSCDVCRRRKVTCNMSGWKLCGAKAKRHGRQGGLHTCCPEVIECKSGSPLEQ